MTLDNPDAACPECKGTGFCPWCPGGQNACYSCGDSGACPHCAGTGERD